MTSGQPWPVRFHSWIFVCIVVAPLPSPSKVTIFTCTFGCVFAYSFATGSRTASTQTVIDPEGALAPARPLEAAPSASSGSGRSGERSDVPATDE